MEESDDYFYRLWYPEAGIKRVIKVQKSAIGDLKTKLHAALRLPADISVSYTLYVSDDDEWYECDEHDLPPKGKLKIETSSTFSLGTPKTEPCRCGKLEKSISAGPSKLPKDQSVSETLQGNDETTTDNTISRRSGKGRQRKKKSKRKKTAPKSDRSESATQNNAESDAALQDDISTKVQAAPDSDCGVMIAEDTANSKTRSSSADQEPCQSEQSSFTQCRELSESPKSNSIGPETKENPEQRLILTSSKELRVKSENQKSSPPSQTLTNDFSRRIDETVGAASETRVLPHVRHQYQHSSTDKYDDRTQIGRRKRGEETTLTTKQSEHVNEDNYSHVNSIPAYLDDSDGCDDDVNDTGIYNNDDTANLHSTESKYEDTQDNAQDAAIAKVPEIPKVKPCYIRLTALELTPTLQRQLDALRSKVGRSNSQVPSESLDEGSQMHSVEKIPSVSSHSGRKSVMNIQTHHTENLLVTCKPNEATTVNNSAKDFQKKERPRVPMKVRMIRRRHLRGHLSKKNDIPSCNDVKLNDTTSTSKGNEHGQKIERPRVPLKVPMVRTKHYFGNFGLPENKNAALNWNDGKRRIRYQVPANALRTKKNVPLSTSKKSSKTISSPVKKRLETPSRTCKNWSNASSNALKKWTKHLSILRQKDQRKTASASGSVIIKNVSEKVLKVCDSSDEIANHNITFNGTGQSSDNSRSVLKSSERSRKRKPERPIVKDEVYQYETRIKRRRKSEDLPKTELGDAREMDMMCLTKDSVGHEDPLDNDDGDDDFDDDNVDDDETYQPSEDELTSDGENEISDSMKEELPCKVEADNQVEGNARRVYDENQTQSKENVPWKSEKISQQLSIRNSRLTDTSRDHQMHSSRAFTENDADSYCNIITIKRPVLPQSSPNDTLVDVPSLGLNVPEVSSSEESEKTNHSTLMNSPMTNDKASSNAFQNNKKATESISCSLLEVDSERVHLDRSANPTEIVLDKRKQETLKGSGIKHEKESLDMVCEEVISETILDKKLIEVESEESSNDGSSLSEQSMCTGSVDGSPSENETSGVLECLQVKHVNSAQSIGSVNKIKGEQKKCKREETKAQVELNLNHDQECSKETLRIETNQDETGAYMYMSSLGQNRRKSERASDKRVNKEMPENNSVSFDHTGDDSVITTLTVRYDGDSFTGLENTDLILKQERRDLTTGAMSHPDGKDLFHCGKMENSFIDSSALIPVVVDDVMREEDNEIVQKVKCGKSTFVNHKYKQYSLQQNSEKVNVLENVNTEDGPTKFIKEKLREKLSGRTSILTIDPVSPLSIDVDDSKNPDDFSQMEGNVHDMAVSERPKQGKYQLRHRKEQIIFIESDDSEREDLFFSNRMKKEDADERFDPRSSGSDSSDDASSNTITPPPRCPNGRFMKMSSSRSKKKNVKPQKLKVANQCDTASNNTTSSKATVSTKSTRQGSISRISEDIAHFEDESNDGNSICADEEGHGRYSLRKRSKSINLVESDVSEDEDDKQNKSRINFLHEKDEDYEPVSDHHESENESTDEYENYDIENRSGVRYEFHRPELEDKWEYMFGEKGTFERLQSSLSKERHVGNELCVYDDSEAFRKCFEYMEWNCKMKCIFCNKVFEMFSDFVQHYFEQNSCEKKVRQSNGYVCSPCGKRGMKKDKMLKHLLRMKSHGPKTAAFIPKSLNDDEMVGDPERFDTFTPGYVCKVCNDSSIWDSLHDAVVHIKAIHTNEIGGKMLYRRREIRKGRVTVTVQETSIKSMYLSCAKCGQFFKDRDALFRHRSIAISHQRCIAQSSHPQNSESHLTEGNVNGNVENSKEDAVNIGMKNKHLDDHSYSHTAEKTLENESTKAKFAVISEKQSSDPNSDGRTGQSSYETGVSNKSKNSKRFKCSRCGYSCSDRDALLKHVAFSHTNVAFPRTNVAISGSSGSQFKAKYSDPQNAKSQKSPEGETAKNAQSCKEDRKNGEPSRNQRNESGKRYKSRLTYHIVRPDLEDTWQYMFGEKGTFERLQSSHSYERHVGRYLCLYEDSEAFRKCFEYMEWNCKMKCIFCCQEFELFSDFVQHFFDENSCDKIISVHRKYACLPCMKRGMTKDQMIKHMLRFKSHGAKKAAFVPKLNDNDKMNHKKDSNQPESFTPGYRCRLCEDSRVWISLRDAVLHIKETHTKESQDSFVYRRRHFEKGKVTISLQEVHAKAIPVNRLYCSTCGCYYTDKDALIEHIASSHQNIAISRSQSKAKDSQPQNTKLQNLTESNVARTAESSKEAGKTKNSSRNTSSESGKKTKSGPAYEIHRPELEDKWEYMYGEKGTFERLQSSHSNERYITNGLCLYDDSEAFRKFPDYMEWNCHMRCIFCNRVFELFSDFIVHFFECDNSIRVPKNFACLPCGKQPLKRNELISHMIEVKTHGTKTAAYIPKSKEKDADWLESFNPGYRCKVCSGSIVMTSFRDAVSHIKREHTKEKDGSFIFRKRRFQQGKVTISVQEIQVRDGRFFCSTCGAICGDKNSLLAHYASFHKNVAFSGGRDNANNPNKDDERSQNVLECDGRDDNKNNKEDKGKPNMEIELPEDETINPVENFSTERGLQRDCSDEKVLFEGNDPSANSGNMGNIQKLCSDSVVENSAASQRDDIQNEDTRQVKYEVVRKDLEDKWEFMYGEKGTFQRLQGSHLGKELCIYEESEAFRQCFDYMEWNCTMRCIFCSLEFDQLSDFMLHFFETYSCEKTIKENKKWVCQPCGKDKMSKPGFLRHLLKLKTHGSKTAAFIPKSTRDDPAGGRLKQDGLSSFTPGYRCKICNDSRIWVTLRDAVVHIKEVHTNEGPGNFMYRIRHFQKGKITVHANHKQKKLGPCLCSFCGKVCRSKYSLLAHLARYHKDVASDQVSRKQLVCPHCGKSFSIYHGNNFNRHLKTHTDPVTCEICGKVYSNENTYNVHRLTHYKKHTCACGKTYSSKDKFCCGKEYICACGKKFKTKQNYLQHERGHRLNGQERQHKCDECGKSFLYKHHLKNHIASYHSTERKFKCGACGASFKLKHHLKQHLDSESACAASN